ncbi:Hypothetical protein PBC10988_4460 [Planctomycetales bacterium 10988]|nr:Hypothetical protein PBC10988_4460 [Planctomycetales bacterium 10988]
MAWLEFFSNQSERKQQSRLKNHKNSPLQLESLEQRHLLAVTPMLIDINQSTVDSNPTELVEVNGSLFFAADVGNTGEELWVSDGTPGGTQLVKDLWPGLGADSNPTSLTEMNGTLFFIANDGSSGQELWKSNGTSAGTQLVKDINPGQVSPGIYSMTNYQGTLFFGATSTMSNDRELWKSDGTSAGTMLVKDINPGSSGSYISEFGEVNGTLLFTAFTPGLGNELWKTDGTCAGTQLVKDLFPGPSSGYPFDITDVNGTGFFRARDPATFKRTLWKTDGTCAGTEIVKLINPGLYDSFPSDLVNFNGVLYFAANDGINGRELWMSDGTIVGTQLVKDIYLGGGNSSPTDLTVFNGTLFFAATDASGDRELWISDGTSLGTMLLKDINPGLGSSTPSDFAELNGTLFFSAESPSFGRELWTTNGTSAGTQLFKDIDVRGDSSEPGRIVEVNGTAYFVATQADTGPELWMSDGTSAGTMLIKDIRSGPYGSNPSYLTNIDGTLYFRANEGSNGYELWKSNGTSAGTQLVKDIYPGSYGSYVSYLTDVNGTLFFRAFSPGLGVELWTSDGTCAGTQIVKDIRSGPYSPFLAHLTNVNGTLFFEANDGISGGELWKSDGTYAGTQLVKNIYPGGTGSSLGEFTNVNGTLFFDASDAFGVSFELWKSDGTSAGTILVKDIHPGAFNSRIGYTTNVNGTLFFRATDGVAEGLELWMSNGTSEGTVRLSDIIPGAGPTSYTEGPQSLTEVNGSVFFTAGNSTTGVELWVSDGTTAGTQLVKDINPDPSASPPRLLTNVNGTLFFRTDDGSSGYELWMSDGTSAGTQLVKDIYPGNTGGYIVRELANVGGTLFFQANDGSAGAELWVLVEEAEPPTLEITPDGGATNDDPILFTFEFSEDVMDFTSSDIMITNGAAGSFMIVDGNTYTLEVNPSSEGDVTVTVADAVAQSLEGADNIGDTATIEYDATAPTLMITPDSGLTNDNPILFTFEFSEDVTGFVSGDIMITNGTAGTFMVVDGNTYTLEVMPTADGDVIVTVASAVAQDEAGNDNLSDSATIEFDGTVPTLMITPDTGVTNDNPILFTFEFSEDVIGFGSGDILITNGSGGSFSMVDGNTYTLQVMPMGDGDVTVTVAAAVAQDDAGNDNLGDSATVEFDGTAPTLEITPDGGITNDDPILFTFTFSETVVDFVSDDIMFTNGIGGPFMDLGGGVYTLEIMPIADGDVTVTVASGVAQDEAGNDNLGDSVTIEYDGTAPTLEITPDSGITNNNPILFTFEFSEEVTGFVSGDIMITNGTAGTFMVVDGDTYTLEVIPTADGDVTVSVASAVAQDEAGNENVGDSATVEFEGTAPTLEITPDGGATNDSLILFTFEFSEDVTGFTSSDIMITNGIDDIFTMVDGNTYTLLVAPSGDGDVTVTVAAAVAQDDAGNDNVGDSATIEYDGTSPFLTITPDSGLTNSNPILFTFEFTEDVIGFESGDIMITNGTAGTFMVVDGNTYTLEVMPTADGDVTVTAASAVAQDDAGNDNEGDTATIEYDGTVPTLMITPDSGITTDNPILFTFEFSEDVTGFVSGDIMIIGGTAGTFTMVDGNTYTLEVMPTADGDVTVTVADAAAQDDAGNDNVGDSVTIEYDGTAPTLEITPDGGITNDDPILFTFTFSETVVDFVSDDIMFTNGIGGPFMDLGGGVYTLEIMPNADGDVTVTVASAVAQDEAGNDNLGDSVTIEYDGTAPTLEITPDTGITNDDPILFTFEFSEEVTGFISGDIMITNGTAGTFMVVDGDTYTLEVMPTADGDVTVTVASAVAQDEAGNDNDGDSATVEYDGTEPTLEITPDTGITNDNPILFTFEFSEDVTGFVSGDIMITNGTAGTFMMIDGNTYTLEVTPTADGDVTVTVGSAVAQDDVGNDNLGDSATIEYDGTAPTLEITPDGGVTSANPILFTFEFSEDVSGFVSGDIMITNGSAGSFTMVDANTYTLEVTPTTEGNVTVSVAALSAQDAAGNDNESATATIEYSLGVETPLLVTGTDAGAPSIVRVLDASGSELRNFAPYTEAFTGGVRVATGDINGDGVLDIVTAAGPGGGPHIQVFDSSTGELITGGVNNFYAYDPAFTGGVFVAVGDVNDDGYDDIVTSPDAGGGPHVKVFDGQTGAVITEFFAYDPGFTGGVRVAMGDVNNDDMAEVITAPGAGHEPYVRVFDGNNSTGIPIVGPTTNFLAYDASIMVGLYVASGDVDGDGFDDIITAPGAGGGPHIRVFDSVEANLIQDFYAYDTSFTGGVRVASADLNSDRHFDILTVPGPGGGPHTRAFNGVDASDISNFYSGDSLNLDGLFIAGGIGLLPLPAPTSAPLSSLFIVSTPEESGEGMNFETFSQEENKWKDEVDEFYQSAEEIDKLFSGLGIE